MSDQENVSELSTGAASGRLGWFASGFSVAAILIGMLLFSDGYFAGTSAMADVPDTIIEGK